MAVAPAGKMVSESPVPGLDAMCSVDDAHGMVQAMRGERALLEFPQSTFRADVELLPFHLGAFLAAAQSRAGAADHAERYAREAARRPLRASLALPIDAPIEAAVDEEAFVAAVRLRDAAQSAIARQLAASAETGGATLS